MSTMGVILSTVEDAQYSGGYHDAHGDIMSSVECSVPWGDTILCNLSTVEDTMIHVGVS